MNANEILTKAYIKIATVLINKKYERHTLKGSNVGFMLYEGNKEIHKETWKYRLDFEKPFDFGYGIWRTFYFNSDEALGRFLFECGINNGMPRGAIEIYKGE